MKQTPPAENHHDDPASDGGPSYWRFAAMIATSMAAMFVLMYVNTFVFDHVKWSETRFYMTFIMGAAMAGIMLSFMMGMFTSTKMNVGIFVVSALVLVGAIWLVRSQETVQDSSYMSAMIPHHSIAILTSERSELSDVRVCELAVAIIEAQRREISEMEWLITDIDENGPAETPEEAEARPLPEFTGTATRECALD
ncbi:MAG: DUF305 domain-containing protein [Actinomycetota bacterium]